MQAISYEELQRVVATRDLGLRINLRKVLERTTTHQELVSVLVRYGGWNQCFKGATAGLVAQLHRSQNVFGYFGAQEAACGVYEAITDEFRDRHDSLLWAFLKGVSDFFFFSHEPAAILMRHPSVLAAQQEIWKGYGEICYDDLPKLVAAAGFHAGSEFMAAFHEFPQLDEFFTQCRPKTKEYLERKYVQIGRRNYSCYGWVKDHAEEIEQRHFSASLDVFTAIMHVGAETKQYFLDGFLRFLEIQEELMDVLSLPIPLPPLEAV